MDRDEHLQNDGRPKRIPALDGGGLLGILFLGTQQKVEDILRDRRGDGGGFRPCRYLDRNLCDAGESHFGLKSVQRRIAFNKNRLCIFPPDPDILQLRRPVPHARYLPSPAR